MKTGRPRTCECGTCGKCKRRDAARERYRSLSLEERKAIIAARDPEKVRAADRARYYRHREKRLARMKEWSSRNMDRVVALNRAWRERNPEKYRAHVLVANAKRKGSIVPGPCQACGTTERLHAHHEDYSMPLDVQWLCADCHRDLHLRAA